MGSLQPMHWLILAVVVILLFGAKKLPDAARSLGKSMRIFKSELREMQSDNKEMQSGNKSETSAIETPDTPSGNATPVQAERVDPPAATEQGHTEARRA